MKLIEQVPDFTSGILKANNMQLSYSITAKDGSLRRLHIIVIDGERLETTREKEVLIFARPRINSKYHWKSLKEAVRLGESLEIN